MKLSWNEFYRSIMATLPFALLFSTGCQSIDCSRSLACCLPKWRQKAPPAAGIATEKRCTEVMSEEAVPAPPGTYVANWTESMVAAAEQQQYLLTRNLWFAGGTQLGPEGQDHIIAVSDSWANCPQYIVIEEEPIAIEGSESYEQAVLRTEQLNETRRQNVIHALASLGVTAPDDYVMLAKDRGVGVRGIEAPMIYNRQTMGQGWAIAAGLETGRAVSAVALEAVSVA